MVLTRVRRRVAGAVRAPSGSRFGTLLVLVAAVSAIVALTGLVAHFRRPGGAIAVGVSAFSPYLMLGAPIALLFVLAARHRAGVVVTAAVTAVCIGTQVPLLTTSSQPAHARTLTVMTANLHLGTADAGAVVHAVAHHAVDVLMVEELTPAEQRRLLGAGLSKALPFVVSDPRTSAGGTGMWSRYPMTSTTKRSDFTFAFVSATIAVRGLRTPPTFAALHLAGPWPDAADWQRDITHLDDVLPHLPDRGVTIVGGDFNATPDVSQFRRLLRHGFADAADQAGAGATRTYPSDRWYPPLIAIDHVLTRDAVASAVDTVEIPGTDHRALVTRIGIGASA